MSDGINVLITYYRTLASQSSVSSSANHIENSILESGITHRVDSVILQRDDEKSDDIAEHLSESYSHVFYKVNFKDVDRFRDNLQRIREKLGSQTIVFLFGPYANLNAQALQQTLGDREFIIRGNNELYAPDYLSAANLADHVQDGVLQTPPGANQTLARIYENISNVGALNSLDQSKMANLEASRGCPRKCAFCHVPAVHNKSEVGIFRKSPELVVNDIEALVAVGKRFFIFNDSILAGGGRKGAEWIERFCDLIIERNIDIKFMAYFTIVELKDRFDLIERLTECGMVRIFVGIESADTSEVRELRKYMNSEIYIEIKRKLTQLGIVPHIGFMLFYPTISPDGLRRSLDFLLEAGELHRYGVIEERTRVLPGTHMREVVDEHNLISRSGDLDQAYDYRFKYPEVQDAFDAFQKNFDAVGKPVFERVEYYQVTTEQLLSYQGKEALQPNFFPEYWEKKQSWMNYCYDVLLGIMEGRDTRFIKEDVIQYMVELEEIWKLAIARAEARGLEGIDLMIATGNLDNENNRVSGEYSFLKLSVKGEVDAAQV